MNDQVAILRHGYLFIAVDLTQLQNKTMHNAPVFIIDDDLDELEIVQEIWRELKWDNPLEVFSDTEHLFTRLKQKVNPFLIICDVNLPGMDGFTVREKLAEDITLSYKSIPFIFWSTTASITQIKHAYDGGAQGFFFKGGSYHEIKQLLNIIITYWKTSKAPEVPKRP